MIHFFYEEQPKTIDEKMISLWINTIVDSEEKKTGDINFIFCDDQYLLKINLEYLQHDYYTDIITFDYSKGKSISGDVFISLPRVLENSKILNKHLEEETLRVIAHGILHLCGYKDKSVEDQKIMREKEDSCLNMYSLR